MSAQPLHQNEPKRFVITQLDSELFAQQSGDGNSIHFGDDAVVHGMNALSKVSAACWERFGDGTKGTGIEATPLRPIHPGEPFIVTLGEPSPTNGRIPHEQLVKFSVIKTCNKTGREKLAMEGTVKLILPGSPS